MRYALTVAILMLSMGAPGARAASDTLRLSVSATVIAACAIEPAQILSHHAACTPQHSGAAPQPTVVLTHGAGGVPVMTITF